MRTGKENGLILPSTSGITDHVLVSLANGRITWSDRLLNTVTTDTTQTVTGAKTFSASTTSFGSVSAQTKLTTAGTALVFEQTGSAMGGSRLSILNETGQNGAMFEQLGTNDLVDFIFKTPSGQGNVRYERRVASFLDSSNLLYEFQIGPPAAPTIASGDVTTRINTGTLKVGANLVYHAGNIPGSANDILYNTGSGLSAATNVGIENGYLRLEAGLPTSSASGGLVLGAADVAGRIMPKWVGPSGLDTLPQPFMGKNRVSMWVPIGNATTAPLANGIAAPTIVGTATARNVASTNLLTSMKRLGYVSATTTSAVTGWRLGVLQFLRGSVTNQGGFTFVTRFGISDPGTTTLASARMFVGMSTSTAAPTNVEPTTLTNVIGLCKLSTSNNFSIIANDGTTGFVPIDLGSNFPANTTNTDAYDFTLFAPPAGNFVGWKLERLNTGNMVSGILTTDLPASTALLTIHGWRTNNAVAAAVGLDMMSVYIETDN